MPSADDDRGVEPDTDPVASGASGRPGPSPLGVAYEPAAWRLWRWVDSSVDATIAAFVHRFVAATADEQSVWRARLTVDDLSTLLHFVRRRALAAIRAGDGGLIVEAFDALSTVDFHRVGYLDLARAACLAAGAARYTPIRARDAAAGAIARATPAVARYIRVAMLRDDIDVTGASGYQVVDTPGGRVLLHNDREQFHPLRDLVPAVLWLAEAIEREGTYVVDAVTVATTLPAFWLDPTSASLTGPALHRLTGCTHLHGHRGPARGGRASRTRDGETDEDHLMAWLAEAATPADATVIADAATRAGNKDTVILGLSDDRRVAVLVNRTALADPAPPEDPEPAVRFRPLLAHALTLG